LIRSERTEVRDGQVFRVVTLPEVKPRKSVKGMRTKREARAIAMVGAGPRRTCFGCKRRIPMGLIAKRVKVKEKVVAMYCGECSQNLSLGEP